MTDSANRHYEISKKEISHKIAHNPRFPPKIIRVSIQVRQDIEPCIKKLTHF